MHVISSLGSKRRKWIPKHNFHVETKAGDGSLKWIFRKDPTGFCRKSAQESMQYLDIRTVTHTVPSGLKIHWILSIFGGWRAPGVFENLHGL